MPITTNQGRAGRIGRTAYSPPHPEIATTRNFLAVQASSFPVRAGMMPPTRRLGALVARSSASCPQGTFARRFQVPLRRYRRDHHIGRCKFHRRQAQRQR